MLPRPTKFTLFTRSTHGILKLIKSPTFSSARTDVGMPCHLIWTHHAVRFLVIAVDVSSIRGRI